MVWSAASLPSCTEVLLTSFIEPDILTEPTIKSALLWIWGPIIVVTQSILSATVLGHGGIIETMLTSWSSRQKVDGLIVDFVTGAIAIPEQTSEKA
ncbi:hypothetical protein GN244_ATG17880 [Phytophthora infestans]|uniref:Uncharacterized protein n=1 Tax=Phytophthora infestans TaxID=4787 RepID=A0A833SXU8_PHYIN|nr:hypothetical protein GN244_ATG17880 [Phytophthora infestans]KAF4131274.1 hypothetical protein GN958_ATG19529 [Phytophthora infestans]